MAKVTRNPTLPSAKLGRTLQELETAFSDWEALNSLPRPLHRQTSSKPALAQSQEEFHRKTRKLLTQLKAQILILSD
jgi:hypothetical protein